MRKGVDLWECKRLRAGQYVLRWRWRRMAILIYFRSQFPGRLFLFPAFNRSHILFHSPDLHSLPRLFPAQTPFHNFSLLSKFFCTLLPLHEILARFVCTAISRFPYSSFDSTSISLETCASASWIKFVHKTVFFSSILDPSRLFSVAILISRCLDSVPVPVRTSGMPSYVKQCSIFLDTSIRTQNTIFFVKKTGFSGIFSVFRSFCYRISMEINFIVVHFFRFRKTKRMV